MKVLVDTNVLIDVALQRQPFFQDSDRAFALIEQGGAEGFVSATTYSDLYYIIRKTQGHDWTLEFLRRLARICQIAAIDQTVIASALSLGFPDFEDAIQYAAAIENQLDGILTRDTQGFTQATIQIFTPTAFIQAIT
ncbi:type II toxin-antitoxin system VapC family toxin [Leptolyngbya sp. NIES-2104]|uniref:type II toxin-antitoxin system VapC family toxin n=1 Tax=Leptolyngbya sp. NIES-2104 TaxID=1552121 RepID=UPI0006EC715E|nr:PIN domain-containing protein [Leptolyngbya sp. NIES-2104]GAP95085.1 PIN domain protein [Leptolyngbya sp. NIES-2104]